MANVRGQSGKGHLNLRRLRCTLRMWCCRLNVVEKYAWQSSLGQTSTGLWEAWIRLCLRSRSTFLNTFLHTWHVNLAAEEENPFSQMCFCSDHSTPTWMFGHMLLKLPPGVRKNRAVSMRTPVTCMDRTIRSQNEGKRSLGRFCVPSRTHRTFIPKPFPWMRKGYMQIYLQSCFNQGITDGRCRAPAETEIDQPACFFSWALRAAWELNVAPHPSLAHLKQE